PRRLLLQLPSAHIRSAFHLTHKTDQPHQPTKTPLALRPGVRVSREPRVRKTRAIQFAPQPGTAELPTCETIELCPVRDRPRSHQPRSRHPSRRSIPPDPDP